MRLKKANHQLVVMKHIPIIRKSKWQHQNLQFVILCHIGTTRQRHQQIY